MCTDLVDGVRVLRHVEDDGRGAALHRSLRLQTHKTRSEKSTITLKVGLPVRSVATRGRCLPTAASVRGQLGPQPDSEAPEPARGPSDEDEGNACMCRSPQYLLAESKLASHCQAQSKLLYLSSCLPSPRLIHCALFRRR